MSRRQPVRQTDRQTDRTTDDGYPTELADRLEAYLADR